MGHLLLDARAITRELPDEVPYVVKKQYIGDIVDEWDGPLQALYEGTLKTLRDCINDFITSVFKDFEFLKQRVM